MRMMDHDWGESRRTPVARTSAPLKPRAALDPFCPSMSVRRGPYHLS